MRRFEVQPKFNQESEPEETKGRGIIEKVSPNDLKQKKYWEKYANNPMVQINIENITGLNKDAVYLYETTGSNQEKRLAHILWIHNNPKEVLPVYKAIDEQEWKELAQNPQLIEHINKVLIENYNSAMDFYYWQHTPRGFVIEGSKSFGMEAGNIAGIRISYQEIKPLIKAIEEKDQEEIKRQKKNIAASIVHELTHLERDDGLVTQVKTEVASHIAQFIFNPRDNEIFNQELKSSLNRIAENRDKEEKSLHLYDKAQYIALLIVAYELSQYNQEYRDILLKDKDPHKLEALKKLQENIREEDEKYLRSEVLERIMQTSNDELMNRLKQIEKELDIQTSVVELR